MQLMVPSGEYEYELQQHHSQTIIKDDLDL